MNRWVCGVASAAVVMTAGCSGPESKEPTATTTVTTSSQAPETKTETVTESPASTQSSEPTESASTVGQESTDTDPDRPDESLNLGEAGTVGNIEVTLVKFQEVTPDEPLDGWTYYGAELKIKNAGEEPEEVLVSGQTRLENIYVATVVPTYNEISEGDQLILDTLRPGSSIQGWVVFGVLEDSDLMDSFGVYFDDVYGDEVVWWNPLSQA